ncbi:LCP family protein [Phytoactinopolyspora halotolerans]|uniref:LCP family protein n=1 Tax=Phytoactinopolyspora halotolerans TaxID=1981512 RepID=A0A6L9SG34_9ACTN|nr:LCP family protein [Phytoactinopolyspora halotolerans]NEE04079.1 LCP family protein [Phytoactinopolyspora halotolerans]
MLAPGSAQLICGNRRLGKIALSTWGVVLVIALLVATTMSTNDIAKLAVQPWILSTVRMLAFALALAWVVILIDAWRLGHPPGLNRRHRLIMVGATVALGAMVSTPFVVAARYAEAAHDLVVRMFPSGEVAAASDGRLNIALLGADSGDGRDGVRPDSIHVVSIDVLTGEPALISLPRNLENARFPSGTPAADQFPQGFSGEGDRSDYLLNATWTYGEENPELFEGPSGPGPTAVKQAIEGTLGIKIHYYVAVDLMGFRDLIDALGGITVEVNEELPIGEKGRVLEPGVQELDGYHALWYARSRESTSDYDRMERQMCVIGALFNEADPSSVLMNFLDLAEASSNMVQTDIPRQDLTKLVDLAFDAKGQELMSLQLVPPLIVPADPDFSRIADETAALLSGAGRDESTPQTMGDGTTQSAEQPAEADADADNGDGGAPADGEGQGDAADSTPDDGGNGGTDDDAGDGGGDDTDGDPVGVSSACSYG